MGDMSGMGASPGVTWHTVLAVWQISPFPCLIAALLSLALLWYVNATRELAERGRKWPISRTVSFLAGLVAVEVALQSSVAVLAGSIFTAHILQHLLLMVVGPPLLALGAPMTLALQTSSRATKRCLLTVLHSRAFGVITHPVPVFFAYYVSMYAFFLTGALNFAMLHMWVMDLINLGFLGGATLFWWPMVGLDPIPRWDMSPGLKLLNLVIGVPVESFLGVALLMQSSPAASMYTLAGTHTGGGVLWVFTELFTVAAIIPMFVQWTRADARAARRIDARLDAGHPAATPPPIKVQGMSATLRSLRRE